MQHLLCKVVNVVSAVGALNWGLYAMGYNLLSMLHLEKFAHPLYYVIGLCGVVSLVMLFTCKEKCNAK